MIRFFFIFSILFFSIISGHAQLADFGTWSSFSLSKKHKGNTFNLKPILRFNEDFGNYNNASIDFIYRRKIGTHWQLAFLERYWWLDNNVNRNFWFFDLGYRFKATEIIVLSQYVRWHIAQDIEIEDPNFLRWHPSIELNTNSRFKPYAGIEFFFRIDGINELQRTRAKIGGTYVASDKINLLLRFWREEFINVANYRTEYIIEFNFGYKF